MVRNVGSLSILAYEVFVQPTDGGTLIPILAKLAGLMGMNRRKLLLDAGDVTASNLALAEVAGVTLYSPGQENDYSRTTAEKPEAQPKLMAKDQFT